MSEALRYQCLNLDQWRCRRCGRTLGDSGLDGRLITKLDIHHRLMLSQGGPDTIENVVTLCGPNPLGCHGWVHAHPADAYELGLLIRFAYGPPTERY